jgi:hypothetical protein
MGSNGTKKRAGSKPDDDHTTTITIVIRRYRVSTDSDFLSQYSIPFKKNSKKKTANIILGMVLRVIGCTLTDGHNRPGRLSPRRLGKKTVIDEDEHDCTERRNQEK